MTNRPWQDAKNRFSTVVKAILASVPPRVTRRNKPAVAAPAAHEHERLTRFGDANAPTLAELLLSIPQDDQEFNRLALPSRPLDSH